MPDRFQTPSPSYFPRPPLDAVPQGECDGAVWDRLFAICLGRDDWGPATLSTRIADMVAVIAPVSEEHASLRQIIVDQNIEAFEVS